MEPHGKLFEFTPSAERLRKRDERNRRISVERITALRQHIMLNLGCANCGAKAGQLCKHDYGCVDTDRRVWD